MSAVLTWPFPSLVLSTQESWPWWCWCWRDSPIFHWLTALGPVVRSAGELMVWQTQLLSRPRFWALNWPTKSHPWAAGVCEEANVAELKLQVVHDSGKEQAVREESQWWSSIDGVAEIKGLKPDQWFIAVNICKQSSVDRRVHCGQKGILCDTLTYYSFLDEVLFYFFGEISKEVGGCERAGRCVELVYKM